MPPAHTVHDVVVVGGRVAGCLTAAGLARGGASVLVLESRTFPSDTLSTHFFRGDGLVRSLDHLGVLDEVLATGAPRLTCEYFYLGGDAAPEVGPPQEPGDAGFCLSVRRRTLDAILAAHVAGLPTVTFLTSSKVAGLVHEDGVVVGVRDATGVEHRAAVVVGADGRRSTVARDVHAADDDRRAAARVMFYRYATGWQAPGGGPLDGPEFSLSGNELVYAFPSDGGTVCVALSVPIGRYAEASRNAPGFFEQRVRDHRGLWPRFEAAPLLGRLFVGPPADSVVRRAAGPGWALVGDAGTHQDPWSGFGMDTAARQADVLATCLTSGSSDWVADYAAGRDRVTVERFEMTARHAPDLWTMVG